MTDLPKNEINNIAKKNVNIKINTNIKKNPDDFILLVERKLEFYKDVIQKTVIQVQKNKIFDIIGISEMNICYEKLKDISTKLFEIEEKCKIDINQDAIVNNLQWINNELSSFFKNFGTNNIEDLLQICFGNNSNKIITTDNEIIKFELIKKYFHPTNYKIITKKDTNQKNTNQKDTNQKDTNQKDTNQKDTKEKQNVRNKKENNEIFIEDNIGNLECFEVHSNYKQFHMKVYGLKIYIKNSVLDKSLVITGFTDDVVIDFLNNKYIIEKQNEIKNNLPDDEDFKKEWFNTFLKSLTLKDYLIMNNSQEIYSKYVGYLSQNNIICHKPIQQLVKEFISDDMFLKRNTLIQLLIKSNNYECLYIAYLLYDLLSNDSNGAVDTQEQTILFDSFPLVIKNHFKYAMKKTMQYTNELSNFDMNKIPLEQQICLLKVSDAVKEKAMMKLKEVKAKSEDSGSKARQYLDGLLKIPFGVYRKEPILFMMENIRIRFRDISKKYLLYESYENIPNKDKYTGMEIVKYINFIKNKDMDNLDTNAKLDKICEKFVEGTYKNLVSNVSTLNNILQKHNLDIYKIKYIGVNKDLIVDKIKNYFDLCKTQWSNDIRNELIDKYYNKINGGEKEIELKKDINIIQNDLNIIKNYMNDVKKTLDNAVHGHDKAKKQIERIIGQWMNGELSGYCFGFEGAPGLGKTTLAKKGLSDCLKDENGISRPFAMIQMGGDSNGSTLHGHNYTYVGSTWGSIVQILIDKKCMNPIIFIDEVDKISKTEHGKEIVGILTHLLDPAQNDCFQDKYFTGIDLDLSKALFILSYNDVDAIDKILLDRVHRIKFNNLSLEDKLIISNNHILPEVYKKMGLEDMIHFSDDVLKFIIEEYTCESGVRKLKEVLFEIVGEINLEMLKIGNYDGQFPIYITKDDVKNKYFKDKHEIRNKKIHSASKVGVINGLWANALGKGGVIPIQVDWRPSDKFLSLFLTGSQGEVMKESMNVALTLAWNLTSDEKKKNIRDIKSSEINMYGVHVHCPETSTPKDGPSAGTAITTAIYSMFNERKIKYNVAITGEICLNGNVTEIGGLDLKILGAIKAGVTEIIFPRENLKDYNSFMEKYEKTDIIQGIKFYPVDTIYDVFELVFESE
jgi:hypothetical protein